MRNHLVLTVSGNDRPGIVNHITKILLEYGGNVEASRMARLGGEFAVLMMVSAPADRFDDLREGIRLLREQDYKVTTRSTKRGYAAKFVGWMPYQVSVKGADHEGIINTITSFMAERGMNIESMDTDVVKAPMSGAPLFRMKSVVLVSPEQTWQEWNQALETLSDQLGVDIEVSYYEG